MAQLPEAVQAAEQARSNRETGIMDLFGEVEEVQRKPSKPVKPWADEVRLKGEKDTLGLYLTGHPIDVYRNELKAFVPSQINELTPTPPWCDHRVCRTGGGYCQFPEPDDDDPG